MEHGSAPPDASVRAEPPLAEMHRRAEELVASGSRRILGITGPPGAGKSTVCRSLLQHLGSQAVVVEMDGFHLADAELERLGRRQRKGAPDTFDVFGFAALLSRLREQPEPVVYAPRFDRGLEAAIAGSTPVARDVPLVITEGNYLLHDQDGWEQISALLDECWFLDVPPSERERRLVERRLMHGDDPEHSRHWVTTVDQVNGQLVDRSRPRAHRIF